MVLQTLFRLARIIDIQTKWIASTDTREQCCVLDRSSQENVPASTPGGLALSHRGKLPVSLTFMVILPRPRSKVAYEMCVLTELSVAEPRGLVTGLKMITRTGIVISGFPSGGYRTGSREMLHEP